jgi:ABC-2 type transport system ATP-binding protein
MAQGNSRYAVEAIHVAKTFKVGFRRKVVEAVKDVSFQVEAGQVFGFLGPNGAGKTTTIKMLMGLIKPDRGDLRIFGQRSADPSARKQVGFLPEQPYFYDYLKPLEFLRYIGRLQGLRGAALDQQAKAALERVGMTHALERTLRKMSKGMLQRVGIAQAFLGEPRLVVLDEPLSGLDPIGRKEIREILADAKARGITLFFSSHILSDIEMLCDRVAIVDRGRVVLEGSMDDLLRRGARQVEAQVLGDLALVQQALAGLDVTLRPEPDGVRVLAPEALGPEVAARVVKAGLGLRSLAPVHATLEEVFVKTAVSAGEDK